MFTSRTHHQRARPHSSHHQSMQAAAPTVNPTRGYPAAAGCGTSNDGSELVRATAQSGRYPPATCNHRRVYQSHTPLNTQLAAHRNASRPGEGMPVRYLRPRGVHQSHAPSARTTAPLSPAKHASRCAATPPSRRRNTSTPLATIAVFLSRTHNQQARPHALTGRTHKSPSIPRTVGKSDEGIPARRRWMRDRQ